MRVKGRGMRDEKNLPTTPPAPYAPRPATRAAATLRESRLPGIAYLDDLDFGVTDRAAPFDGIAGPRAEQRLRQRGRPADLAARDVGFVVADDREALLPVVLVAHPHRGAEMHFVPRLAGRIDDGGALELGVEVPLVALDLAQLLLGGRIFLRLRRQLFVQLQQRLDRKSTRLNSSHRTVSRMPSSA